ncbi:MAG: hypothetical protein AAF721_14570 [Myxococcota bacterium]
MPSAVPRLWAAVVGLWIALPGPTADAAPAKPTATPDAARTTDAKATSKPDPTSPAPDRSTNRSEATDAPASPDPYAEQAPLDVATLLTDTSKAYLQARGRLVAHPVLATSALLDRLEAVPAPTKSERKRLLDVLGELGGPDHLPLFAAELRRAVKAAADGSAADKAAATWLPLIVAQGSAATGELSKLVGDKDLLMSIRAAALDAMVGVTPGDKVGGLVVLVGRGNPALRSQLTRSLQRRVAADTAVRATILTAADDEATAALSSEPRRAASLLQFRAALSAEDDAALAEQLSQQASDAEAAFVVRVAAVRGLSRLTVPSARAALVDVARQSLNEPVASTQAGVLLAWLSLSGLPPQDATPLVTEHRLRDSDTPRLASLGYALAPLPAGQAWLPDSQENPWPQVRQAALARVEGPCPKATVKLLARRARPKARGGDKDPAVARANVTALGRCGPDGYGALVDLLGEGAVDIEQRTEAARQLTKHGGPKGANAVAAALSKDPPRRFARRLVAALRWVKSPTPEVTEALCRNAAAGDNISPEAKATLELLHSDPAAACNGE